VQGKFQMFLWISLIFKIKKKKISTQKGFGMIAHKKMLPVLLKPRLQLLKNVFCLNCCITSGEKTCYKFLTVYFSFDINILRGRGRKLSVMYSPQKWFMIPAQTHSEVRHTHALQ
jgi:hypothetical protein